MYYNGLLDELVPISGRPILAEMLYEGYEAARCIPSLRRSTADFTVGSEAFVIVSIKGGADPNLQFPLRPSQNPIVILQGNSELFIVDAQPFTYLSYQWYFKNKPIPNETSYSLWIDSVTPAQAGIYKVALSTGGKWVMSKRALLTVVKPVVIKTPPKTQTVKAGKPATFRVAVTGTGPFTYQWYWNGNPINHATKSYYSIPMSRKGMPEPTALL